MAHYVLKDQTGKILEEYDYPDPLPSIEPEFKKRMDVLITKTNAIANQPLKDALSALIEVLKQMGINTGIMDRWA
jgi:excinuclease UvrABC helicase subunit UvrB